MKKFSLLFVFLTVFLVCPGLILSADFRSSNWGDTRQSVKKSENKKSQESGELLIFQGEIADIETNIGYEFINNKLARGAYIFNDKHINNNNYINDYESINKLLIKKYGEPLSNDVIWSNDMFKDDSQNYGNAISLGQLAYQNIWETKTTTISHKLIGENFKINHGVTYESKAFKQEVIEKKEGEATNQL